ncbi:MAG: hypothetical protein QM831_31065 [Kofleriaceae bacterium]
MTASAVVTITCPSCGGKVEGAPTATADYTIKCTYCGTELHVPRVGPIVIREVREVVQQSFSPPIPEPIDYSYNDPGLLRSKGNPVGAVIAVVAFAVVGFIFVGIGSGHSSSLHDDFEQREKARAQCESDCKARCANVPVRHEYDDVGMSNSLHETDVLMCTTNCETDNDCYGIGRTRP